MGAPLNVVIIHHDPAERERLRSAIEAIGGVTLAGERTEVRAGLALAHQVRPGLLVMELSDAVEDGLSAATQFKMSHPDCAIFLMTDRVDSDILLRALRAGAQEVLKRPLDRSALTLAIERVLALNAQRNGGQGPRRGVITVYSPKGGSGISTIAVNLAVDIREIAGHQVVLADFDHQSGDAAFMLGLSPRRSVADLASGTRIDSASVQDTLSPHASGIQVLAQPEQLDRAEGMTPQQIGTVLEILSSTHETVVVDAPHAFNDATLEIFDRSSTILLVTERSVPALRATRRSLDILTRLNFLAVPGRVRLVVNRESDQSVIDRKQIEDTLGLQVFATIANDHVNVSHAINMGEPLCREAGWTRVAKDIDALARTLIGAEPAEAEAAVPVRRAKRLRFFGKG